MTYDTLLQDTIDRVAGFDAAYDAAIQDNIIDDESGMHTVFSLVFMPMLRDAINNKKPQLRNMLNFMEEMESSGDVAVSEVLEFTIMEELCDEYSHEKLWELITGEESREAYKHVRRYMPI